MSEFMQLATAIRDKKHPRLNRQKKLFRVGMRAAIREAGDRYPEKYAAWRSGNGVLSGSESPAPVSGASSACLHNKAMRAAAASGSSLGVAKQAEVAKREVEMARGEARRLRGEAKRLRSS